MNETIKTLLGRRSVRKFTKQVISDADLELILKAGSYAPSAMGRQPCKVLVIETKDIYDKFSKLNAMGSGRDPFHGAQKVLVVISEKNPTAELDGAAVIMNMANAAFSLGIDSCWINRAREMLLSDFGKETLSELELEPEKWVGIGCLAIGYRDGRLPAAKARKADFYYRLESPKRYRVYHISKEKNEKSQYYKKWRIRLRGSDKTIKFFNTQKEAIDEATRLAREYDGRIVIHKVDGSIRKQDYSKK